MQSDYLYSTANYGQEAVAAKGALDGQLNEYINHFKTLLPLIDSSKNTEELLFEELGLQDFELEAAYLERGVDKVSSCTLLCT